MNQNTVEHVIANLKDIIIRMHDLVEDCRSLIAPPEPQPVPIVYEMITKEQVEEIEYLCRDYPDMLTDMLERLRLESLDFMPKSEYRTNIERLRKIVDARKKAP